MLFHFVEKLRYITSRFYKLSMPIHFLIKTKCLPFICDACKKTANLLQFRQFLQQSLADRHTLIEGSINQQPSKINGRISSWFLSSFQNQLTYGIQNILEKIKQPIFTMMLKEAKSATMNIFRKKIFSFLIICKSRIKICFHNKSVHYSWNCTEKVNYHIK